MTRARLARMVLHLVLAATLVTPLVAADEGRLSAQELVYHGGAKIRGDAMAFFAIDHVLDPDRPPIGAAEPATVPVLGLDIDAARVEAAVFESHHIVTAQDAAIQADPRYPPAESPERFELERVKAQLVAQQDDFQINLVPADPGGSVPFTARMQAGRFDPQDAIAMGTGQFRPATASDADVRDPGSPEFWQVRIDAPLVVHEDMAAQTDITFTGTFVLELLGATLEGKAQDADVAIETGVWRDEGLGTGLPVDQPAAAAQRTVFARLTLVDATVRITLQGGSPGVSVAALGLETEHAGEATLLGAVGAVTTSEGVRELDSDRYVIPPLHTVAAGRDANLLALAVTPTAVGGTPAGADPFSGSLPSPLVAIVAVLALLAAAGLGLARRVTRTPDLAQVEAAIEAQRFGLAARLAKRILRAKPASEDAMLGRAIALSKGGHADRAIREIHAHLERRDASDGALHYVLGLAFLDVGREDDARAALAEAVRRTPSLQADVASRLGQQASSPHPPTSFREAHGYA